MRLRKLLKKNRIETEATVRIETRNESAPKPDANKENMFSPKVAYRVLFQKKPHATPTNAPAAKTERKSAPAEKPTGRDRILKYLGIAGSLLLCAVALSGVTLGLAGLLAVIILTIDPDNRFALFLQKIYGGKNDKKKK